ncbi:phosphoribosylglycinamide formyltransferase [Enterococcus asini]|nr:phosphoribosylglycinamide formyltransferase [Enterococcus asini]
MKESGGKEAYEKALLHLLQEQKIDFVILAGYLRILGKEIIEAFPERILNIHPSLLPSFPGLHGIQDAFNYGVKVTGVTVHFVDCGLDTGPIIAQEVVAISPEDTLETLEAKIHQVEHQLYPRIIGECLEKENHS